jgi:FkbM family methyltransferase
LKYNELTNPMTNGDKSKALRLGEWLTRMRPLEVAVFMKWLLRVRRFETEVQGFKLWVDPASNFGKRVLREGTYEPELTCVFRELLKPGQTFVDVGANEGWFSMLAAKIAGPSGRVLACEPQERLWPVILQNIASNRFCNVRLFPFGLSAEPGRTQIALYPSLNTGSSHIGTAKRRWEKTQSVELVRLDSVLEGAGVPAVDLLKIDVEGYEHEVLLSAGAHLGTTIKTIVVELHPPQLEALGSSEKAVIGLLEAKGYVCHAVDGVEVWELRG